MSDTPHPFPEVGPPVDLVKWPMAEPPSPENSITHGRTRDQVIAWVGDDEARALAALREESDKFEAADVELLHALNALTAAGKAAAAQEV